MCRWFKKISNIIGISICYFHLKKIEFFFKQTLFIRFDHLVTLLHINHLALEFGHIAVHYNSSFRSGRNFYTPSLIVWDLSTDNKVTKFLIYNHGTLFVPLLFQNSFHRDIHILCVRTKKHWSLKTFKTKLNKNNTTTSLWCTLQLHTAKN